MRIIAGKWRSVPLLPPPDADTRPILDQVKEALFNILGCRLALPGELPPLRVLDLFAGTGSLGLEALSRGAAFCTFVEGQAGNARALQLNIDKLRAGSAAEVHHENAWKADLEDIAVADRFDLVFLDPPFRDAESFRPKDRVPRLLARMAQAGIVKQAGIIVLRHPARSRCDGSTFAAYELLDQRTYGDMTLTFLLSIQPAAPTGGAPAGPESV